MARFFTRHDHTHRFSCRAEMMSIGIAREERAIPQPILTFALEIRLVCDRDFVIEEIEVALGADIFDVLPFYAPVTPPSPPRLIEGARILHAEGRFHQLAVFDDPPALDDSHLLRVRCS